MGRALIITCAGLIVAFGFTIMSVSAQKESMTKSNVNSYYHAKASNMAHTGVQIAIYKYEDSNGSWTGGTLNHEGGQLALSWSFVAVDTIQFTSHATYKEVQESVIYTFDVTKEQKLVPEFKGALSIYNGNVDFTNNNNKTHFNGNDKTGKCSDKPGVLVGDESMDDGFNSDDLENIEGNPEVDVDESLDFTKISELIEALAPQSTTVTDTNSDSVWLASTAENPGVYFIEGTLNLSQHTGYGILVVRNDAVLNINSDLNVSGQFEFNGLVIFENETYFSGTGQAQFNGTVIAGTDDGSTLTIQANGKFKAQLNCTAKKYADMAVNDLLNTTLYQPLSVYEK